MDSTGNTTEDFASGALIDNGGNNASEDVLHMCKFCDQSFPGLYQYNIHFVTKHLKDSLKSLNQTSKEKICRVISEEQHSNSSNYSPGSNFIVAQKELTGHINRNQVANSNDTLHDKRFNREDYIAHLNAIQNIQQRHNVSTYQFGAEIAAENNLDKPKVHDAYSSDTHNTNFADCSDLKLQSNDRKYNQVSFERNSLITQSLSNIMESYSKVIGEEVELEVKIRVRPIKDKNIQDSTVPHKYDIKQETLSLPSNSCTPASSHSSYDKSFFCQKDIGFHQNANEEMTVKSYAFSHHLNKNIVSDFSVAQKLSPNTKRNAVLSSKNGNDTSNKVFQEVSDNESDDIVVIEDPYLCEFCNLTFSQKSELSAHLCSNANRQNEDLTNEMILRGINRKNKNSQVPLIGEKGTKDACKVEIQFSCKTCQRIFFDEDKFEAHYCDDINEMDVQSEYLAKNTYPNEAINETQNNTQGKLFVSEISSESNKRTDRMSFQNDDPDICIIEEPYSCGICKKVFSQKNELDLHSCTQNMKRILAKKNSNKSLKRMKNNSSYGSGLNKCEFTVNSISKNTEYLNNRLLIKEVSSNSDICMSETHYSCNVCKKHFSAKNDLDNHACTQTQEHFSVEVDSNDKINISLNLPKNCKDMSENQANRTKVVHQYHCDCCGKGFSQQLDLYAHMNTCDYRNNTKKKPMRNPNSGKGADSHCSKQKMSVIRNVNEDFAMENSERDGNVIKIQFSHMCDKCHEGFFDKSNLDFHMHTHIENEKLFCIFCKEKFALYSELMDHFNRHKKKKLHFCFHCSKGFIRQKELKVHLKTHKIHQTYNCDICKKCFDNKRSLKGHICQYASSGNSRSKQKKGKEVCNICNQTFSLKIKLKKHLKMHKKDSLICNICSLTFKHIKTLTGHLYRHANTRPYLCLICYSGCFAKRGFLKHLEKHTEERSYSCDICEISFGQSRDQMLSHMKTHKVSPKKRRKDSLADSF